MQTLHFIAGLPRSGSTLLSAILRQNPAIHAAITSPVAMLFDRLHQAMSSKSDYAEMLTEVKRANLLRGLFASYYKDIDRPIAFDTNRHWCSRMAALNLLFPQATVIACVRDPVLVLDSFERLWQASPLLAAKMFTPEQAVTVHTRIEALAAAGGVVGFAYDALAEAYYGLHKSNLIVIEYEQLCKTPGEVVEFIYKALRLAPFAHRFDDIEQPPHLEYDGRFGMPDLHRIRPKIEWLERKPILPPEIVRRFSGKCFWRT